MCLLAAHGFDCDGTVVENAQKKKHKQEHGVQAGGYTHN